MEQKKKLRIWFIVLAVLVAFLVVLLLLLWNLNSADPSGGETRPSESGEPLVDQRTIYMNSGEGVNLILDGLTDPTVVSSNPEVVSVAADGSAKALKAGNAIITVSDDDETYYCGIIVDAVGQMLDVTKLRAKALFTDMMLNAQTEISGMAYDTVANAFYFTQSYGPSSYSPLNADIIVSKVVLGKDEAGKQAWTRDAWMRFYESGSGIISAENVGGKTMLWLESNGSLQGSGSTISCVAWEDEACLQQTYGETYEFPGIEGFVNPVLDTENDLILAYDTKTKTYKLYGLSDVKEGEAATYLTEISCEGHQTPVSGVDDSQGRYNASIRGYVLADGYIYQLSGSSSIYISAFDLEGNLQYCHRLTDYPDLETRLPAAITYADGKLYVTVQSGNSTCYFANVWVYEGSKG